MPNQRIASSILRYHLKDINRSLKQNITTSKRFLRHAARVVFGDENMLGFPPLLKTEFQHAMLDLEQSGEVSRTECY